RVVERPGTARPFNAQKSFRQTRRAGVRSPGRSGCGAEGVRARHRQWPDRPELREDPCHEGRQRRAALVERQADRPAPARLRHRSQRVSAIAGGDGLRRENRRPFSGIGAPARRRPRAGGSVLRSSSIAAVLLLAASPAAAHGFGQRFDLPLPLWLWVSAAGATIVLTFAAIALFVRERSFGAGHPQLRLLELDRLRPLAALLRLAGVLIFVVTLCAGFIGVQDAYRNLITPMVWVLWWVGFAFVCALLGNLWALVNPLTTIFIWVEGLYAALTGSALPRKLPYPAWLDVWPAVVLFLGFAWAELVWRDKDVPAHLARALLCYAALTWIGMLLYGRELWLKNGEAFSVVFDVLARFAPLYASQGRLVLRPPGAGLITNQPVRFSFLVFVLLMLASVTFDGFKET